MADGCYDAANNGQSKVLTKNEIRFSQVLFGY